MYQIIIIRIMIIIRNDGIASVYDLLSAGLTATGNTAGRSWVALLTRSPTTPNMWSTLSSSSNARKVRHTTDGSM